MAVLRLLGMIRAVCREKMGIAPGQQFRRESASVSQGATASAGDEDYAVAADMTIKLTDGAVRFDVPLPNSVLTVETPAGAVRSEGLASFSAAVKADSGRLSVEARSGNITFQPASGGSPMPVEPGRQFEAISVAPARAAGSGEWVSIFNGVNLDGWQAPDNPGAWSVRDGVLTGSGSRTHLFYTGKRCSDCEFKADVRLSPGGNSGILFRTVFASGVPRGYEAQIAGSDESGRTGSLYGFTNQQRTLVLDGQSFRLSCHSQGQSNCSEGQRRNDDRFHGSTQYVRFRVLCASVMDAGNFRRIPKRDATRHGGRHVGRGPTYW